MERLDAPLADPEGSGKSTVAEFLRGRGWPIVRFGEILLEEEARGQEVRAAQPSSPSVETGSKCR